MAKGIDISRDIQGLNELQKSMQGLKSEYNAITQAQKYDAQSTELLTAKKESLRKQLEVIAQQTKLYSEAQEQLAQQLDKGNISASDYEREIVKLDQAKQKLHYTSIALQGQLGTLVGTVGSTANTMGNLAIESNASSKAMDKQTKSAIELAKEMQKNKRDWMAWANLVGSAGNMLLGLNNTFKDWNAVNEDGTPKMNASAKAAAILAISMQAVAMIAQLAKLGIAGLFIGAGLVAGGIWVVTNALNSAKDALGGASDGLTGLGNYQGLSASVNRTTTQRSEQTVNYNMNINANKYGQDFANNPKVVDALSNAVNRNLGKRIIRT